MSELAGCRLLIVCSQRGRSRLMDDSILGSFIEAAPTCWIDDVQPNPSIGEMQTQIARLFQQEFDAILAFGGGSVIDTAKALSIIGSGGLEEITIKDLLAQPGILAERRPLRLYAAPTTAGTGSEVTPFSTIWDHERRKKHSLAGSVVFPYMAVVDAALTDSLSREITLSTGLDAINQAAESIWNKNATPVTIGLATRALALGFRVLPMLVRGEGGSEERNMMAESSVLAGLAISHTRTAICHSISYPLTAHFGLSHGLACAFTMPAVLRHNLSVDDGRFTDLAEVLVGNGASEEDLVNLFGKLYSELGVRRAVASYIPSLNELLQLKDEMLTPERANNTLAAVTHSMITDILREAWEYS